jgi:hypothetical protein
MLELLILLCLVGGLLAAPFVIIACWFAIVFLAIRLIPYAGWIVVGLIAVTVLGGCAKPSPAIEVAGPVVPDQLLTCRAEPVPPATGTQRKVALYVIDLVDAGADCRSKLGAVRSILR